MTDDAYSNYSRADDPVEATDAYPAVTGEADDAASHDLTPSEAGEGAGLDNGAGRTPRHNQWTRAKMAAFLRELAATQNVSQAARAVGMSRRAAYNLRTRKPGTPFALAWEVALEAGLQQLAHAVMDRALNGEEVPHYYHGELVGTSRRFDNRLAEWVLDNPWKLGRQQLQREFAAEDWDHLLDQVEFGTDYELRMTASLQADFEASLSDADRELLADPWTRAAAESWYAQNQPARGRRARR